MAPTGAREHLLRDLRAQLPQQAAYQRGVEEIASFCAGLEPSRLFTHVAVPGGAKEGITPFFTALLPRDGQPVQPFLTEVLTSSAATARVAEEVDTIVWAPTGLEMAEDGVVRVVPVVTTSSGEYVLQAIRVDTGAECRPEDFKFFAGVDDDVDSLGPLADSGSW